MIQRHFSIWKTTILGGVVFLLPFAIVLFVLGQMVQVVYSVAGSFDQAVPDWSIGGVSLAVLLATLVLVALCYVAGLLARLSFSRRFSERIERNILLLFPRYAIWKSHLATNVGAEHGGDLLQFRPVLVVFDDRARIGFEIERTSAPIAEANPPSASPPDPAPAADATVTVYLPSSPDPWNGQIVHVGSRRVKPLAANFAEASAVCEAMGRGAGALLAATPAQKQQPNPREN
jgi:uncharacterized membrane protein